MIEATRHQGGMLSLLSLIGVFLITFFTPATAAAGPAWEGALEATMQRFDFTTSATSLAPDAANNVLGVASAQVVAVTPPGSGWQDPSLEYMTPGINGGDGAWDLGPNGYIDVTVPVSPAPPAGLSYDIEFYIETVIYQGIVERPVLSVVDHSISGFDESSVKIEDDYPFGSYDRLTWTGSIHELDGENLVFRVAAGASGAVVDSIKIHTRYSLNKSFAAVTLSGLEQLFDGAPKPVVVTTVPAGLNVIVTYDGAPTPPVNTGSYEVVATIDDAEYSGSAVGILQIANESQNIVFPEILDQVATNSVNLSATGGNSGNPVTFEVTSGPAVIDSGNVLSFTGAGQVTVTASQAGDMNYLPAPDVSYTFNVSKAAATLSLTNLSPTYDGSPKSVGLETTPPALVAEITYNGALDLPSAAGSYTVQATINDPLYEGTASATLTIGKAEQILNFAAVGNQTADATVNLAVTGGNSGNPVVLTVDFGPAEIGPGQELTFTGAGAVSITATQAGGPNYLDATPVTRSFVVSKANATVMLSQVSHTYDGVAKEAIAETNPPGLDVILTYNGDSTRPIGAGEYALVATINDAIYEGSTTGTFVIAKASQTLDFDAIADQTADSTVNLSATGGGSTSPVVFVVDAGPATLGAGDVLSFTGAGQVTVTASQEGDSNYLAAASASQTFTVTKAAATVSLEGLSQTYDGTAKDVTVTTVPENLPVTLTYDASATAPTEAGIYAISAVIDHPIYMGSVDDTLEIAKAAQSIVFDPIANQLATATVNLSATVG